MAKYKLKDLSLSKLEYGSGAAACDFNGDTRYVRITDITDDGKLAADVVSPSYYEEKHILHDGDILFARTGATVGKTFLYRNDYGKCVYAGFLIRLVPDKSKVLPPYIYYFTKSPRYSDFVSSNMKVVAQPNINAKQYGDLEIDVPSFAEQKEVVGRLAKIDGLIALRKEQLAKLDQLVKSRFTELFGNSDDPAEPLDNNVIEMFIGPFGSSLKNECFVDKKDGFCMVYEQKHAIQKTMDVPTRYVPKSKYEELKRFTVVSGDMIVSCRGTIGEIFIVPDDAPMGIMHPSIMKIRLNTKKYNQKFFVFLLEQYMDKHNAEAKGSGVKMAVSATVLGQSNFVVPPMEIQNRFAAFVEQTDKSKLAIQQSLDKLELLKKVLMQEYFG